MIYIYIHICIYKLSGMILQVVVDFGKNLLVSSNTASESHR